MHDQQSSPNRQQKQESTTTEKKPWNPPKLESLDICFETEAAFLPGLNWLLSAS